MTVRINDMVTSASMSLPADWYEAIFASGEELPRYADLARLAGSDEGVGYVVAWRLSHEREETSACAGWRASMPPEVQVWADYWLERLDDDARAVRPDEAMEWLAASIKRSLLRNWTGRRIDARVLPAIASEVESLRTTGLFMWEREMPIVSVALVGDAISVHVAT